MQRLIPPLIVTGVAVAVLASAQVGSAASPSVARAVIWPNFSVTVSPKSVKLGTVVFKIKNRDGSVSHKFSIDGATSPSVKPHTTIAMTVVFKKRGLYFYALGDSNPGVQMQPGASPTTGGALRVT